MSAGLRLNVGDCPVFKSGCPFKTVCSNGAPLIDQLEQRRWAGADVEVELDPTDPPGSAAAAEGAAGAAVDDDDDDDDDDDEQPVLSRDLKHGTKDAHKAAESCAFVKEFLSGRVTREQYQVLLSEMYYLYQAMEEEFEKAAVSATVGRVRLGSGLGPARVRATLSQHANPCVGPLAADSIERRA